MRPCLHPDTAIRNDQIVVPGAEAVRASVGQSDAIGDISCGVKAVCAAHIAHVTGYTTNVTSHSKMAGRDDLIAYDLRRRNSGEVDVGAFDIRRNSITGVIDRVLYRRR